VTPLIPIVAGLAALALGVAILRSFGPRFRVGRILAVAPLVSVAEASDFAAGRPRYVSIQGRIDATDEFEDDAHRPLVLRRIRFQLRRRGGWATVDEQREAVDFEVREGLDAIAIDQAALDEGLVVLPRQSVGTVADAPDRVPAGVPPSTPLRLRIEQVSSIEHAIVAGVPSLDPVTGAIRMTGGLGRPLILTTLERDEAMRILASDAPRRPMLAVASMVVGMVSLTIGIVWAILGAVTGTALAASPAPSGALGGDPRSSGQGPGLVGDPLTAIVLVLVIGIGTAVATAVYVWMTGGRRT
jgi:hypothetical protein